MAAPYLRPIRGPPRDHYAAAMVRDTVRTLWAEPRAPHPPARVWRDWVLVAVLVPTALLEGVLRDDVVWRPVSVLLGVALPWTLLWRRTHPLAVVVVAFGAIILADIASLVGDADGVVGLYTMVFVLLLPYSLVRWGSGREIGIGLAIILVTAILGIAIDYTGVVDSVVGFLFLLFPATLGATVRYWTSSRLRELDQVKLRERAQLARELHDTVAHHVSAIAIRAQAGRVVAATHPEAALDALERDRGGGVVDAGRDARHGRRPARRARPPRSPRSRGWPTSSGSPGAWATGPRVEVDLSGRPRRPRTLGRGCGLPHRPGVGDQRRTARAPRDPASTSGSPATRTAFA